MLTVFQLLLSLVAQQTEDDQHNTTNEPAQDNQLEQTQVQSENAEETDPTSGDHGRTDLGNEAAEAPEGLLEAENQQSERSDVTDPLPNVVADQTSEPEREASEAMAEVGQEFSFKTDTALAESETREVSDDSLDAAAGAPEDIATIPDEAVGSHVETPLADEAADGGAPEISSQAPEIIDSATPEPFEIAEAPTTASSESAGSEKESPGVTTETPFRRDVRDEVAATVSDEATSSHVTDAKPHSVSRDRQPNF